MPRKPQNPASPFFKGRNWKPFAFQQEVWDAYRNGESGLIHAATGTGKTLAAWLGPVIEWMEGDGEANPPLRVLWITPLRALVTDTERALEAPLTALEIPWTLSARTGDTKPSSAHGAGDYPGIAGLVSRE